MSFKMSPEKKQNGNWKKYAYLYSKHKNLTFKCLCSKNYTSFPALYLHCQRKHGKKISTQLVKQQCIIAKNQNHKAYIYTFDPYQISQNKQNSETTQQRKLIEEILNDFLQQHQQVQVYPGSNEGMLLQKSIEKQIIEEFRRFLLEQRETPESETARNIVSDIPYYFNSFYLFYRSQSQGQHNQDICEQLLLKLGRWLLLNKYTQLVTIPNVADIPQNI